MAKVAKFHHVSTQDGFKLWHADGVSLVKDGPKFPFDFHTPAVVTFPGIPEDQWAKFEALMVSGAYNREAVRTRLKNDTTFMINGKKRDCFSLSNTGLSRWLNASYMLVKQEKNTDAKGLRKLNNARELAIERGLVTESQEVLDALAKQAADKDVEIDFAELPDRFSPQAEKPKAEIVTVSGASDAENAASKAKKNHKK